MTGLGSKTRRDATTAGGDEVQLHHLMRAIIATVRPPADAPGDPPQESVLLDTLIDGMRYLLVQMPPAERSRLALSPRELEIVRMVAHGHPNKIIADILNISAWTVCAHVRRIFAKLGVTSRAAMVARLLELDGPFSPPVGANGHATRGPRNAGLAAAHSAPKPDNRSREAVAPAPRSVSPAVRGRASAVSAV